MANRRMFSLSVVDTDRFLDMSPTARLLYYDLGMRADDDGFLLNAQRIALTVGASKDDLRMLIARGFLIPFESGAYVVRHWRMNNQIRADRHRPTVCTGELKQLCIREDGEYELMQSGEERLPDGCRMVAERLPAGCQTVAAGEDSTGEIVLLPSAPAPAKRFIPPKLEEVAAYCAERQNGVDPEQFLAHYEASGWMRGKTKIRDWRACVRTWEKNKAAKEARNDEHDPYASFVRI
ncbi:MAG: hypothetical protein J6K32_02205 [Clostridia bacterium]|nr:hypothetical protein [Clostridia bacterium]